VNEGVRLTMQLRDRLLGLAGELPWIQSVLAVPLAFVDFQPKQNSVWVLREDDLVSELENAPVKLNNADVARFAKAIDMIQQNTAAIYQKPTTAAGN
jgi:hypothetical protein